MFTAKLSLIVFIIPYPNRYTVSANSSTSLKIYFPNLNALRFIAAFLVIIHHSEQLKVFCHKPNIWENGFVQIIGKLGVVLFFVLSGFLISFLLFKEQEVTKTISIKDFYIRRILRIWPLYFLIVLLSFFILPFIPQLTIPGMGRAVTWDNLFLKLALYVFFLPNLVLVLLGVVPYASQTWSIGAEEQFYLIWPLLNKKVKNKWALMSGALVIYLVIVLTLHLVPQKKSIEVLASFWEATPIDCMAIGGIFALIIYQDSPLTPKLRRVLFSRILQWSVLLLTLGLMFAGIQFPVLHKELYALLFGVIISNFAYNRHRIFSMENPVFNYLGKVSYGLYMFHPIAIVFTIRLMEKLHLASDLIFYPLVLAVVILMASLSYEFFEKRFIRMKVSYSKLISGDNAHNGDN